VETRPCATTSAGRRCGRGTQARRHPVWDLVLLVAMCRHDGRWPPPCHPRGRPAACWPAADAAGFAARRGVAPGEQLPGAASRTLPNARDHCRVAPTRMRHQAQQWGRTDRSRDVGRLQTQRLCSTRAGGVSRTMLLRHALETFSIAKSSTGRFVSALTIVPACMCGESPLCVAACTIAAQTRFPLATRGSGGKRTRGCAPPRYHAGRHR
jgi:hypothetical protein